MSYLFWPRRVVFEKDALSYSKGEKLYRYFTSLDVPISYTTSHNRVTGIPGRTSLEKFNEAKKTLVVGVRRTLDFQSCRPSANYQLPLVTGCPGRCHYCYLHTSLGKTPYLRVYVNVEEVLKASQKYIKERDPEITSFEGSAVSDPFFAEPFTGAVSEAVSFFAMQPQGRFRMVTKYAIVDPILSLAHRKNTFIRFSVNNDKIIQKYEKGTSPLNQRLEAAKKVLKAGYPTGLMVAPIFLEDNWKEDYKELFKTMSSLMPQEAPLSFELITHRFTLRAKKHIAEIFPYTDLPMEESNRRFKYGQFGYGKYLYPKEIWDEAQDYFHEILERNFPKAKVEYYI